MVCRSFSGWKVVFLCEINVIVRIDRMPFINVVMTSSTYEKILALDDSFTTVKKTTNVQKSDQNYHSALFRSNFE